jgi:ADP-dependent NAD(P)H-hydrate dehydratase / NAD(P)H-hydrate epimerase
MKAVTTEEMRRVESDALAAGWSEGDLLRSAGTRLGWAIGRFFPKSGRAVGYLGKGHNAGDVVVALGVLRDEFGWDVAVRCAFSESEWAPLLRDVWGGSAAITILLEEPEIAESRSPLLLLDGLAGIGLLGALREPLAGMVREMAHLRRNHGAIVAAADVPSGIDADTGRTLGEAVVADVTFSIGNMKVGLLESRAVDFTGALAVVPLEPLASEGAGDRIAIAPQTMAGKLFPRPHETHKTKSGRVAILAGSVEYPGAAVLCATAALRSGAGMVFLHVPHDAVDRVVSRCPPEIIVRGVDMPGEAFDCEADACVVGCGLGAWGRMWSEQLVCGICEENRPVVIDADALNAFSEAGGLDSLGMQHVLTPHPGEFRRLAPDLADLPREDAVRAFAERVNGTLLLKGARTLVSQQGGSIYANTTGHPGMATGGQGDWLAGIVGALLAGGQAPLDAACIGAWIAGRCGEIGVWHFGHSQESLCPSDFSKWMGQAFTDWRMQGR